MEGEIVAVGPGARNEQGVLVLFDKWSGSEVKLDGEELLVMKETDLMGVTEGAPSSSKPLD